ncbi:MAG: efflux RND transporter periplasmic adaptor subunit [Tannerella sp.]|jgi:RND family efflux transporter MFP subunit|nr:efflux RND transporter periplasmic adaptor subunit [Tannerella sp.]
MKNMFDLSVFVFVVAATACSQVKTDTEEIVRSVKTDTARIYGEQPKVVFPGKVKAASEVDLSFRAAGTISVIRVNVGAFVGKGDTLAGIDPRDYEIQLAATEAEYRQIRAEAERIVALYEKGSVTQNDYDKAVYGLKQIAAKYDAHKNALADTRLVAPFDGYVQKRFFVAGETVGAGMPVLSMIDAGAPEVEINIPSAEYIRRDRFESFSCEADVYPGRIFPLELIGITQKANMNQLYTVRLKMKGRDRQTPSPGMATMVTIRYRTEASELVRIPYTALFEINSASSVWVCNPDNSTVTARKVVVHELHADGTVVVSEGLKAGEIVVTAGVHSLGEGEKVKRLSPVSATNVGGLL